MFLLQFSSYMLGRVSKPIIIIILILIVKIVAAVHMSVICHAILQTRYFSGHGNFVLPLVFGVHGVHDHLLCLEVCVPECHFPGTGFFQKKSGKFSAPSIWEQPFPCPDSVTSFGTSCFPVSLKMCPNLLYCIDQ